MTRDLSPTAVAARLSWLREHWVADDEAAARARLEDPAGLRQPTTFDREVARRLAELRAMCELTRVLHGARR